MGLAIDLHYKGQGCRTFLPRFHPYSNKYSSMVPFYLQGVLANAVVSFKADRNLRRQCFNEHDATGPRVAHVLSFTDGPPNVVQQENELRKGKFVFCWAS